MGIIDDIYSTMLTDKKNSSRIFLAGDIHGCQVGDCDKLTTRKFPEQKELTKKDYVIILGDFGLIWNKTKSVKTEERHQLDWLENKNFTTLFLDGNHENFARLDKLPQEVKFGNLVGKVSDSIYHLKRGFIYNIGEKSFFTFGGGFSIDQHHRTENISWWKREMPEELEYARGIESLKSVNNTVDYILSHSCSSQEFQDLTLIESTLNVKLKGEEDLRDYFTGLFQKIIYKKHFYGHFHMDHDFGKHQVLYNKLVEL